MARTSWLLPEVTEQQVIPAFRWFGGLTAPVWTMALGLILRGMALFAAWLAPAGGLPVGADRIVIGVLSLVVGVTILAMRWQVPNWFLHLNVTLWMVMVAWLTATAASPLAVPMNLMSLMAVSIYVGAWFPPHQTVVHLAFGAVASFVGVMAFGELREMFVLWLVAVLVSGFSSIVLNVMMRQMVRFASSDGLTGVLNRAGLIALVEHPVALAALPRPLSLVVLDLDDFKQVNDTQGHQAGDELLVRFGEALRARTRSTDVVARTGGDEFLLLLGGIDEQAAIHIVERMRSELPAAASFGVAEWGHGENFDDVLAAADAAMYLDKGRVGRTR